MNLGAMANTIHEAMRDRHDGLTYVRVFPCHRSDTVFCWRLEAQWSDRGERYTFEGGATGADSASALASLARSVGVAACST
jgi:hypothetical protein